MRVRDSKGEIERKIIERYLMLLEGRKSYIRAMKKKKMKRKE